MRKILTLFYIIILIVLFSSFNEPSVEIRNGFYVYPEIARVIRFFEIKGNKISYYRSHAGHYAAFGKYRVIGDSILIIEYSKTIASQNLSEIEQLEFDSLRIELNTDKKIELIGLTYEEPETDNFYKGFSKLIRRQSKNINKKSR